MLNIAEYRRKPDRLSDYLPWAALVAPGILLNKDGSFLRSFRFRGPDLDSATDAALQASAARINNVLRRLGSGWALFFDARREAAASYPASEFPDPVSALVDAERRAQFESANDDYEQRRHYESRYYLSLCWLPPPDHVIRAGRLLIDSPGAGSGRAWRDELRRFSDETTRIQDLLAPLMAEFEPLDDAALLTYLHGAISERAHPVSAPETPVYLDAILADAAVTGGLEPMLGESHLRTVTILGFPGGTRPGLLDALNRLDFGYRWVTRFIPLDRTDAAKVIMRYRRQWFAKRKSILLLLREVLYHETPQLIDSDAANKMLDADEALQSLGTDTVSFGYLTVTVTVADPAAAKADEKLRAVERTINGLGFTTIRERMNALEAWLGSLPGHLYANIRQPLVHTLNLAHLMPASSIWAGPARNGHLDGPPLFYAETKGTTPFRFSTHVGDVGHALIVGPTGAGKSVLLAFMALQFRRYPNAQVFLFDKGLSARAAILAMGGQHYRLDLTEGIAFQPLSAIDALAERSWAAEWIGGILAQAGEPPTPEQRELIWSAFGSLSSAPPHERTITGLSLLLASNPVKSALLPFTVYGPFGRLLDGAEDGLKTSDLVCFEMEQLMQHPHCVAPVLTYLFHRLEQRFDGRPTLLMLDEAWLFLDQPLFAARIRDWLKSLRKKNVAVIFATQSLADIADSTIAPAIIESCPQRIFLPNDRASEPQIGATYERFGLNDRQIAILGEAVPKRDYYLQSQAGNRLFELGLGPVALSLCGASQPADQALIDSLLVQHGSAAFAGAWLGARGLDWAAQLLETIPIRT
jgi:type IV secretion/conjugal transfer VirB4 family ATPase